MTSAKERLSALDSFFWLGVGLGDPATAIAELLTENSGFIPIGLNGLGCLSRRENFTGGYCMD